MRTLFRIFIVLDLIALVFVLMQLGVFLKNQTENLLTSERVQGWLLIPISLLMVIGIIGLIKFKRIGLIAYYFQFPVRLYLWVFSLGFITLLPEAIGNFEDKWFDLLLKACFLAEFLRLYFTIKAHIHHDLLFKKQ